LIVRKAKIEYLQLILNKKYKIRMKHQAIILSVIALASAVSSKPEIFIPHNATITGVVFHENSNDLSDRTFYDK